MRRSLTVWRPDLFADWGPNSVSRSPTVALNQRPCESMAVTKGDLDTTEQSIDTFQRLAKDRSDGFMEIASRLRACLLLERRIYRGESVDPLEKRNTCCAEP
jgi:hypothetical protein